MGNFFPRRPAILTDVMCVRGVGEERYRLTLLSTRLRAILNASSVVRDSTSWHHGIESLSPAFHMRVIASEASTINTTINLHIFSNMSTANTLSSCVSSLRSSMQLLDSSISILDSGTSDFPRLARVLQATRVRISSFSFNFHYKFNTDTA